MILALACLQSDWVSIPLPAGLTQLDKVSDKGMPEIIPLLSKLRWQACSRLFIGRVRPSPGEAPGTQPADARRLVDGGIRGSLSSGRG